MTWLLVAIGGAAGAAARYLADISLTRLLGRGLPWGTLTVNLVGSAALGVLAGLYLGSGVSTGVMALFGTGFCGALTTASTLTWETVALAEDGRPGRAATYVAVSLALGLGLAGGGLVLGLAL